MTKITGGSDTQYYEAHLRLLLIFLRYYWTVISLAAKS